jgi:predicted FMN-binding regulatory protein PaiB
MSDPNEFREIEFKEIPYDEITYREEGRVGNLVKAESAKIDGKAKISINHDDADDVKVIIKKDENDNIKEIKFVCSCGQTKSVMLDYSE